MWRKKLLITLLLLMIPPVLISASDTASDPVSFERSRIHGVAVNMVRIDMASRRVDVSPVMASGASTKKRRASQSFRQFIDATRPVCAINGTHFDTATLKPVSTIIIDGRSVARGAVGSAVCFTRRNTVEFRPLKGLNLEKYRHVICAGPTLLRAGKAWLNPRQEKYRDPRIYGLARRSAIGVTGGDKLILVTTPGDLSLKRLSAIMLAIGCRDAVALDGGSSSALYYRGKYITVPARRLTNVLAVSLREPPGSLAEGIDK